MKKMSKMSRKQLILFFLIGAGLVLGLNYVLGCSSLGPTEEVPTTTTRASTSSTTVATTTTIYTPPLSVISVTPTNGATSVPLNSANPISAVFNKGIDINSISSSSFTLSSPEGSVPGAISYDEASNTLTFHSSHTSAQYGYFGRTFDLDIGTPYIATVSSGLKDYFGGTLATPYNWSFTTMGQVPPPTISPPSGSFVLDTVVTVEIQSVPGATIHYTVDGNDPSGGTYSGTFQLTISQPRSVRAYAAKSGMVESEMVIATYTVI